MRRGFFGPVPAVAVLDPVVQLPIPPHVLYMAASKIQAVARGCASRRRDLYRLLPVVVTPGDRFVRSAANFAHYMSWLAAEYEAGGARRDAAAAVHSVLAVTHHDGDLGMPMAGRCVFGPFPAVHCHRRPCNRCNGAGGYDREGPFNTGARGRYHFRHIGPWTVEGVRVSPDVQYQTVGQWLVDNEDN